MSSQRLQMNTLNQMANPIFNDILGVDPRLIGLSLGASRILDAITDPIVGYMTDSTRSRFGRRRPWIAASSILCAVGFIAIWMVPRDLTPSGSLIWFTCTTLFLFMGMSIFSVPYSALGMELTPDYHERTSVMAYQAVMSKAGGFLSSSLFMIVTLDCFDDMAVGMRYTSMGLGVVVLLFTLIPVFACKEHPTFQKLLKKRSGKKIGIIESSRHTLQNRPFIILIAVTAVMLFGLTMVSNLSYYLTIYHVFDGTRSTSAGMVLTFCGYAAQIGGLLGIPVMAYAAKRIGKRKTLLAALALAFVGDILKWFCYTPESPYLALLPNFIQAFCLIAVWTLIQAMIPDVVDYEELKSGERQEGMFSAFHSWIGKLGISGALIISGFILNGCGFDADLGANQSSDTIFAIRIMYCLIPACALILGFILLYHYPITENKAYAIRTRLERRRKLADLATEETSS